MTKLTKAQRRILQALADDGPLMTGFLHRGLHRPMKTLVDAELVAVKDAMWRITPAGRAALQTPGDRE